MRKALLVLAAVLVSGAAQANEATWKWDGEIRTRYNYMNNQDLYDEEGNADEMNDFQQRNKFGMTVNKGERLMGRISLINHFNWGNDLPSDRQGTNSQQDDNQVNVHEAYMWWKANDMVSVMAGRIAQEVADGSVISKFDFDQHPYAFDGVGLQFDLDFANIMGFGVKGEDDGGASPASSDPESVYYGLTADLKNLPDVLNMVHLHYLNINQDPESAAQTWFRGYRYGLTVAGATAGLDFRGTYAGISGDLRNNDGDDETDYGMEASMYDLEVGYTLADVMGLRIAATYHSDTGNTSEDTAADQEDWGRYNGFYYDQHKYAGLMDVFEFGNLTYTGVMVSLMPQEDVTVGLGYYMFSNTSAEDHEVGFTDRRSLVTGVRGEEAETDLGSEIDVWVEKSYDNGLSIRARYGQFTPGAFFEEGDANSLPDDLSATEQQGMIQATLMF